MSIAYQKPPEHLVALPGDPLARVTLPGLVLARDKPQTCSHRTAFLEAIGILQGKHKGQRGERPYSRNRLQLPGLPRVAFLAASLYASVVYSDPFGERADGLNHVFKGVGELIGDLFVEALCPAFGQPRSEGLDRPSDMVDQLRTAADQCWLRAHRTASYRPWC